jgi:hypothetical protein
MTSPARSTPYQINLKRGTGILAGRRVFTNRILAVGRMGFVSTMTRYVSLIVGLSNLSLTCGTQRVELSTVVVQIQCDNFSNRVRSVLAAGLTVKGQHAGFGLASIS